MTFRNTTPLIAAIALLTAGCGGDPNLPEATGKGSFRVVNAISTSPDVVFLIETINLGSVAYQGVLTPRPYDDLTYTFNFEVQYAGESGRRRIASRNVDIVADRDYTFLLTGTLASTSITLLDVAQRTFNEADTVFAARFAHTSTALGALDYYFADPAVVPALGNEAATLSFGEVADAADFTEGEYVLTITTAGNPGDVVYTSSPTTYAARDSYLVTAFDGDASDTGQLHVNAFSSLAGTTQLPDSDSPPTVQLIHASLELGTVDIYNDEMLTSLVVDDQAYLDVSPEIPLSVGANTLFHTPSTDTSAVLLETPLTAFGGLRYRAVVSGPLDALISLPFAPDLRSIETGVKTSVFQTSVNFLTIDLYAVEPDTTIDDVDPIGSGLVTGLASTSGVLPVGDYDFYVTPNAEKTVLAGPYRLNLAAGDVLDLLVVDTVDPNVLDVLFLSGGPSP